VGEQGQYVLDKGRYEGYRNDREPTPSGGEEGTPVRSSWRSNVTILTIDVGWAWSA
jgi:hypothetical protein